MNSWTISIGNDHAVFLSLLCIHITCGFTSFFSAFGAMLSAKGKRWHRLFGKFFIGAMSGVFVTAIPLSLIIHSLFLFLIAIFSYYLAFSGWRYAKNRSGTPKAIDWTVSSIMLFASLIMIGLGVVDLAQSNNFKHYVLMIFGMIGLFSSTDDLNTYLNRRAIGQERIIKHLRSMLGATIAAITAFSVTNIPIKPSAILWIAPTLLLTPVIIWWQKRVRNK